MIIWGTYVTKKIIQKGQFYCPHCAQPRDYNLRRPKKWGHLYWIPLIPMQEFDRYVECKTCDQAWNEGVLQHDPIRDQQARDAGLTGMLTQAMLLISGEGGLTPALTDRISAEAAKLFDAKPTAQEIATAAMAGFARDSVLANAAAQAEHLNDRGKEAVLRAVIAAAPRPLGEREWTLATDIGHQLGMSAAHMRGVMAEMAAS